jgi:hypothetical protein
MDVAAAGLHGLQQLILLVVMNSSDESGWFALETVPTSCKFVNGLHSNWMYCAGREVLAHTVQNSIPVEDAAGRLYHLLHFFLAQAEQPFDFCAVRRVACLLLSVC